MYVQPVYFALGLLCILLSRVMGEWVLISEGGQLANDQYEEKGMREQLWGGTDEKIMHEQYTLDW